MNMCYIMLFVISLVLVISYNIWVFWKITNGVRKELLGALVMLILTLVNSYLASNVITPLLDDNIADANQSNFWNVFSIAFASYTLLLSTFYTFVGLSQAKKDRDNNSANNVSANDVKDALDKLTTSLEHIKSDLEAIKRSQRPFLCRLLSHLCKE